MSKYILFFRREPAQVKGKGADRGDLGLLRGLGDDGYPEPTEQEKKDFFIVSSDMTDKQATDLRNLLRWKPLIEPLTGEILVGTSAKSPGSTYLKYMDFDDAGVTAMTLGLTVKEKTDLADNKKAVPVKDLMLSHSVLTTVVLKTRG
jgi:hypothetical protein